MWKDRLVAHLTLLTRVSPAVSTHPTTVAVTAIVFPETSPVALVRSLLKVKKYYEAGASVNSPQITAPEEAYSQSCLV